MVLDSLSGIVRPAKRPFDPAGAAIDPYCFGHPVIARDEVFQGLRVCREVVGADPHKSKLGEYVWRGISP